MKILAIGDTTEASLYNNTVRSRHPDIDLILSCGDVDQGYLDFLVSMLSVPMYYVRGNHDGKKLDNFMPGSNIDEKIVKYKGVRIAGLEGSMWYGGRGVEYTEKEMRWKAFKLEWKIRLKGGVDILLAHAPPSGIDDMKDECHKGFQSFRKLIDQFSPRYFLHAHIHSNYLPNLKRVKMIKQTKVINCSGSYTLEV